MAVVPLPPRLVADSEHQVLGALLSDPSAFGRIEPLRLHGSHFGDQAHSIIYTAAAELHKRGELADLVTVFERLQERGQAERCGGLSYLNQLCQAVLNPTRVADHAQRVLDASKRRRLSELGERIVKRAEGALPADELQTLLDGVMADLAEMRRGDSGAAAVDFSQVAVRDLLDTEEQPQRWWWHGYVPAGNVTLWSGHGGVGKSLLALMLLVAMAMGRDFLGKSTKQCRCLFFSAEDPARTVRQRLRRICRDWDVDPVELAERMRVIDATELDAALYVEQRVGGVRHGDTTPTYEALRDYIESEGIDVVVLDNASDVFDGDEIVRTMVRGFIRSLARLVRQRDGALILLSHVDKGTSRAGKTASRESYSGSTAWHNSSRSLLTLLEVEPGLLELQHQKCNLGAKQSPVRLRWPDGQLPALEATELPPEGQPRPNAATDMRNLVALIREYYARGEWIATAVQSRSNAAQLLSGEARYPRHLKPAQVVQLLREAQRAHYIEPEAYKGADRKPRERWAVTAAGAAMIDNLPLFVQPGEGAP